MKVLIYRSFANRCDAAVVAAFDHNGILLFRIQNLESWPAWVEKMSEDAAPKAIHSISVQELAGIYKM
jgi:hypothetical protein